MADVLDLDPALLPRGTTPLHLVANNQDPSPLSSLLQHHRDQGEPLSDVINRLDRHGRTPLCVALQNGRVAAACCLIEAGADLGVEFADTGQSHSDVLCSHVPYYPVLWSAIADGIRLSFGPKLPPVLLFSALSDGNLDLLQTLLEDYEMEVDSRDHMSRTPLHYACQHDDVHAIETLLRYGARITPTDCNGSTPLHVACAHGHTAALDLLLQEWVCPEPKEVLGMTDSRSRTCAHVALYQKQYELFVHLSTHFGEVLVNLEAVDDSGHSLPGLLFHLRHITDSIPSELASTLPFLSTEEATWSLMRAASESDLDLAQHCLPMAQLDVFDHAQHTPLMWAATLGNLEMCRLLVDAGAGPNVADPSGQTCLQCACEEHHTEVVRYLLSLPDINTALLFDRFSKPLSPALLGCFLEYFDENIAAQKPAHWQKWLSLAARNPDVTGQDFSMLVRLIAPANWLEELAVGGYVLEDPISSVTPYPLLALYEDKGESVTSHVRRRPFRVKRYHPSYNFVKESTISHRFNAGKHNTYLIRSRKTRYYPLHDAALSGNASVLEFILDELSSCHPPQLQRELLFNTCNDSKRNVVEVMAVNFARVGRLFDSALVELVKAHYEMSLKESLSYESALLHYLVVTGGDTPVHHAAGLAGRYAHSPSTPLAAW